MLAARLSRAQQLQSLAGIFRNTVDNAPARQLTRQCRARRGMIVDDQHAQLTQHAQALRRARRSGTGKLRGEPEIRSLAKLAAVIDLPAHQCHELFGDREAQPAAAKAARCRSVRLHKGVEYFLRCIARQPDARVAHFKAQQRRHVRCRGRGARWRHGNHNLTAFSKFDRIADQIQQYLTQPARIASHHLRQILRQQTHQFQALFMRGARQQIRGIFY